MWSFMNVEVCPRETSLQESECYYQFGFLQSSHKCWEDGDLKCESIGDRNTDACPSRGQVMFLCMLRLPDSSLSTSTASD